VRHLNNSEITSQSEEASFRLIIPEITSKLYEMENLIVQRMHD
jgi:hypothetical protein